MRVFPPLYGRFLTASMTASLVEYVFRCHSNLGSPLYWARPANRHAQLMCTHSLIHRSHHIYQYRMCKTVDLINLVERLITKNKQIIPLSLEYKYSVTKRLISNCSYEKQGWMKIHFISTLHTAEEDVRKVNLQIVLVLV